MRRVTEIFDRLKLADSRASYCVRYQSPTKDGSWGRARSCWCVTWEEWVDADVTERQGSGR